MIRIDSTHAPLVVIDYLQNVVDSDVEEAIRTNNRLANLESEHVLLTDLREERLDCSMSEILAKVDQCLQNRRRALAWNCRGVGVLVSDDDYREVGDALLQVVPSEIPARVFSDSWEVVQWGGGFFVDDGDETLERPPALRADLHHAPAATASSVPNNLYRDPDEPDRVLKRSDQSWSPYGFATAESD